MIDIAYLNDKIMELNQQRTHIHQLAEKYGLKNDTQLKCLRLIDDGAGGANTSPRGAKGSGVTDPHQRIKEYNARLSIRREKMHARNVAKKAEQEQFQ